MAKKKKTKKVVHVLNDDCKMCMRERNLSEPIIRDMLEAKRATLVNMNYTFPGLLKMNDVIHRGIMKICDEGDKEGFNAIDQYFEDIRKLIQLVIILKGESNESN